MAPVMIMRTEVGPDQAFRAEISHISIHVTDSVYKFNQQTSVCLELYLTVEFLESAKLQFTITHARTSLRTSTIFSTSATVL